MADSSDGGNGTDRRPSVVSHSRRPSNLQRKSYIPVEWEEMKLVGVPMMPMMSKMSERPDEEGSDEASHHESQASATTRAEREVAPPSRNLSPNINELLEHVIIRLRDPTDADPMELILKPLQHNAYVINDRMACDCEVEYVGPDTEDIVLRVFTGSDPRHATSFVYMGHIHAMQAAERRVRVYAKGTSYILGVEILHGLNKEILQKKTVQQVFHERKLLALDPQGLPIAVKCDFLIVFASRDTSKNSAWTRHLEGLGPRSGPWGNDHVSLNICTDWSLGIGQHFGTEVELSLGRHGFGKPPIEPTASAWFEELLSVARLTRYGILIVDISPNYFKSRACHQELFGADWERIFVYLHIEDRIVPAADYAKQLAQDVHPVITASREGDYIEVVENLRNDVYCYDVRDIDGNGPLSISASKGDADAAREILRARADPDARDNLGVTSLHRAVVFGHSEVVERLLGARADVDGPDDHLGITPLHEAARLGRTSLVSILLEARAYGQSRDNKGHTPLGHAFLQGRMDVVQLLHANGYWEA